MPNALIDAYKRNLAEQGYTEDRPDYLIIRETLAPLAEKNPELFEQYPDFAVEYRQIREANAPSLGGEVTRGLKRGGLGLLSVGAGGLSLFTGDGWLRNKARELEQQAGAPELQPTIPMLENVAPGEPSTTSKVFSRDAVRYAASKFGEAAPSIAEAVGTGLAGAAAGTLVAPGAGTIVGGVEGFLGRSIVRKAVQELVKKGVTQATPEIVAAAARQVAARAGGTATAAVNSYLLNTGDVMSEIPDSPGLAAGLGLVSAIPDTILPVLIIKRLFPGVAASAAKDAAKEMVANRAVELGKKIGLGAGAVAGEGATEWFQEAVNVVARNIEAGVDPLEFSDTDFKRFREAGITGLAGGLLAAPAVAIGGRPAEVASTPPVTPSDLPPAGTDLPAAGAPTRRTNAQIVGQVELMTDEEKLGRIAELQAKAALAADEEIELQILLAEPPKTPAPTVTTPPPAPPVEPTILAPAAPEVAAGSVGEVPPPPQSGIVQAEVAPEAPQPPAGRVAPVVFFAIQSGEGIRPDVELWNLTEDIPGHPNGSTLTRQTLEAEGFTVPPAPEQAAPPAAPENQAPPAPPISNPQLFAPAHGSAELSGEALRQRFLEVSSLESTKTDGLQGINIYTNPEGQIVAVGNPQDIFPSGVPQGLTNSTIGFDGRTQQLRESDTVWGTGVDQTRVFGQLRNLFAAPIKQPVAEQPKFTRAQITNQRRVVKDLRAKAEKAAETDPKRAAKYAKDLVKAEAKLTEMEANKLTGRAPQVGNAPDGTPDLLTTIAEYFGRIQTVAPEGLSSKGGEYNGWKEALAFGAAKLLNGGENGDANPEDVFQGLNDSHGYAFGSISELQDAISRASAKRKETGASQQNLSQQQQYEQKVERAAMENKGRSKKLTPASGVTVPAMGGVGAKFRIDGEPFSVIDVEQRDDGVWVYLIQDGHPFKVLENELFYPDKGSLKKAPKAAADDPFFGTEPAAPEPEAPLAPDNADWTNRDKFPGEEYWFVPRSVIVQFRGLDTEPLGTGEPLSFPYDGTAADAAEVFRNKVIPMLNDRPNASRRESILNATDENGRAIFLIKYGAAKGQVQVEPHPRAPKTDAALLAKDAPLTPLNAPKPDEVKPVVPSAVPPPPVTPLDQTVDKQAEDAKKILDAKAVAFTYGRIIEGLPTLDFRQAQEIAPKTSADWVRVLKGNVAEGMQGDKGGNRALTRIALLIQGPNGETILSGIVSPQFTLRADGTREVAGLSLQQMGEGDKNRLVKDGGDKPALIAEVIDAGWKPLAVIHFDGQPSKIFQRFTAPGDFDSAYGATDKTAATRGTLGAPKLNAPRSKNDLGAQRAKDTAQELERQIDELRILWEKETDPAAKKALEARMAELYTRYIDATERGQDQTGNDSGPDSARGNFGPRGAVDPTAPNALRFRNALPNEITASDRQALATIGRYFSAKLGQPVVFTAVEPAGRDRWADRKDQRRPSLHADGPPLAELRTDLERVFGKRILFFTANPPIGSGALSSASHPNYILVNALAPNTFSALVGHELGHDLNNQRPDLYRDLSKLVLSLAPMPDSYMAERHVLGYERADWEIEYVNDVIGDRFSEPEFWTAMGREAQRTGLADKFRQLLEWIGQWLGFRSPNPAKRGDMSLETRGEALREIVKIREAVARALIEFTRPRPAANTELRIVQDAQRLPLDAARAQQFQQVVQRLRAMGGRVDQYSREFFAQGVAAEIQAKISGLEQQMAGAPSMLLAKLSRQVAQLRARLGEVQQARGAAFSPWHMAIAMDDVMNADPGNLVTLLHEAAEGLAMRLSPEMRGAVSRAVDQAMAELRKQAAEASATTGIPVATETGTIDRLSETLAQQLVAEGIPEAPSFAAAIVRWVKDLYYRTLMAVQRAFGAEPDGKVALDWFENQLRRIIGGDYDYRFAQILDRYLQPPMQERVRQFVRRPQSSSTPGGLADYFNPFSQQIEQPVVLSDSRDALLWNVEFQTGGLAVPDPESRARQHVAAINRVRTAMEKVYADSKSDLPWEEWWQLVGTGEDPKTIPSWLEERFPGIAAQQIGGERMTKVADGLAALEARSWLERIEANAQSALAKARETIDAEADSVVDASREVNEIEGDRRDAQLQSATLEKKLKDLIKRFVQDYRTGLTGSVEQGRLAQAVRQADELLDSDPVPENYQRVFKSILDGQTQVWDYIRAIAELELPFSDMTDAEVRQAITANGDGSPALKALAANKPLLVALATLARANAAQMADIRMAYLKDTEQYSKLHAELEKIRQASDAELQEMFKTVSEQQKAATFGERIKQQYIKRRRALRTARERINRATARAGAIEASQPGIATAVEQAQIGGGTAPSEWMPVEGAEWKEMVPPAEDGDGWTSRIRKLRFNADGTAVDFAGVRKALFNNKVWLDNNQAKAGGKTWQEVYRQTTELVNRDLQRAVVAVQWHKMFRMSAPLISDLRRMGGREGAEGAAMMNKFAFIIQSHRQGVATIAHKWSNAWQGAQKAAGIPDNGQFQERIYDPISYFLNTNPGLEEDAALRQATRMARDRLIKPPGPNFDAAMFALLRETKAGFEYLVKLGEQYGAFVMDERLKSSLRNAVARGWLTSMRSMDNALVMDLTGTMQKSGWKLEFYEEKGRKQVGKANTFGDLTTQDTALENSEGLSAALDPLFPASVKRNWLLPFINKGGVEIFKWEEAPIPQLDLQTAWATAGGNVLRWIDNLAEAIDLQPLTGGDGEEVESLPVFRLSILKQLDGLFGMESKLAYDASQSKDLFDPLGPKPHVMLDARVNDLIPPEHLNFAKLDDQSARLMLSHIAFHAAFGRNGERMATTLRNMTEKVNAKAARYQMLTGTTRGVRLAEAITRGWDFKDLEAASTKQDEVKRLDNVLRQFMSVGTAGGPFEEAHAMMELLNFMAGQIIDNPKTGFYDVLSLAERPSTMRSLGPATVKATAQSFVTAAKTAMGGILEAMHIHLLHASAEELELTQALASTRNLPWTTAISDIGPYGRQDRKDRWFFRPLKLMRFIQNKGVAFPGQGQAKEFPRAAVIPGLGVNSWMGQAAAVGGMKGQLQMLERMVRHGIRYLANHKDAAADPTFRFKARDLGLGRMDTGVFEWWRAKTPEFGLGNLEDIVRDSTAPAAKGERLFSKQQVLQLAHMYSQELAGQSSVNTMPSLLVTNPLLRLAFPLLRWPFWAMHHVHEGLTTQEGRKTLASVSRGLATLALWNLPLGLAFTLLLDRYDEDALGKKSNLPPVGKTAALPIVGPAAELIMSDRSIPDTLKAYLVRMARAGNVGGLAADFAGKIADPVDSASGRRTFSLDQRVLVMSQLLNASQALSNAMNQDWTATWASVWSPLMRSVGGNAALHTLDIANKVLGLDNAESRLVMRINATSWLRSAASELDVPLRHGGMGTPTPMSVWTRDMLHSAMAGDRVGFMDAYRKAKEAAMKSVSSDPTVPMSKRDDEAEQRVLAGWRGRDPLSIFAHRPTDTQLNRLLSILDEDGRADVRQALQRYDQFTQMIKPSAFERVMDQRLKAMMRAPASLNTLRRQQVGALY